MNKLLRISAIMIIFLFVMWIPFNVTGLIRIINILSNRSDYRIEKVKVESYNVHSSSIRHGSDGHPNPWIIAKVNKYDEEVKVESNQAILTKSYLQLFQFEINNYSHFLKTVENNNDSIWVWGAPDAPLIYARNENQVFSAKKTWLDGSIMLISIMFPIVVIILYVLNNRRKSKYEKS